MQIIETLIKAHFIEMQVALQGPKKLVKNQGINKRGK